MKDIRSFVTLGSIVKSYLNAKGIYDLSNFKRFINVITEGFGHINVRLSSSIERCFLEVNENNIALLPPDYISKIVLGIVPDNSGFYYPLTEKQSMVLPSENCGDLSRETKVVSDEYVPSLHYGVGGGRNVAYYKIWRKEGYITFDGYLTGSRIYFEYSSTGVKASEETLVPFEMGELLREYLNNTIIQFDDDRNLGEKAWAQKKYEGQLQIYNSFINAFTLRDIADIRLRNFKQTVKR